MIKKGLIRLVLIILPFLIAEFYAVFFLPSRGLTYVERIGQEHQLNKPKGHNEKRIFIFGASSVIGYHHMNHSSFSEALRFLFENINSNHEWKVVNFGKVAESSEFVFSSAIESLEYDPNMMIIYTGENEFIPPSVLRRRWKFRLESLLLRSKVFRVIKERITGSVNQSVPDFSAYSYKDLVKEIQSSKDHVVHSFLKRMRKFDRKKRENVLAVYIWPIGNLRWAPSFHDDFRMIQFDPSKELDRWFMKGVLLQENGKFNEAVSMFQKIIQEAPQEADAHFRLGDCLFSLGQKKEAIKHYESAVEFDPVPNRAISSFHDILKKVSSSDVFIDMQDYFTQQAEEGIVANKFVEDNCHPTIYSELLMAKRILQDQTIRDHLGIISSKGNNNYHQYLQSRGLDNRTVGKIYSRIVLYHDGRTSGNYWLQRARQLAFNEKDVQNAGKIHSIRIEKNMKRKRQVLEDWIKYFPELSLSK